MALPRFFDESLSRALITGDHFELDGPEAHHALRVLRLETGAKVIVFDGRGGEVICQVVSLQKRIVNLEVVERTDSDRELKRGLHVIAAIPKGDRQKVLVDGLVQFGVTRLSPLKCERAVVVPKASVLDKLRRNVIEFSKQCGRNVLMEVTEPISIGEAIAGTAQKEGWARLVAHPYGEASALSSLSSDDFAGGTVVVGPEGGLVDAEVLEFRNSSWTQVTLGDRILRVEMAALNLAAWWSQRAEQSS